MALCAPWCKGAGEVRSLLGLFVVLTCFPPKESKALAEPHVHLSADMTGKRYSKIGGRATVMTAFI